jgi:Tfp pilus assembly protein PilE
MKLKNLAILISLLAILSLVAIPSYKYFLVKDEQLTLSPKLQASKAWLEKQLKTKGRIKNWGRIYAPNFDWAKAALVVSPQNDTVVEIPYLATRKGER